MGGWAKLFSTLPTSSLWSEDYATRIVFISMLSSVDSDGIVEGSIPGLARLANVTSDEMRAAVVKLSSPDPDSRTPDHEGRRIEPIEGGFRILNYLAYRDRGQAKEGSKAPAMRAYRARLRAQAGNALPQATESGNALPQTVTSDPEAEDRSKKKEERTIPPSAVSSEPSSGSTPSAVPSLLTFSTIGTGPKTWGLTEAQVENWRQAFPGLDVLAECRRAAVWIDANPSKRKTAKGMPAFLVRWLSTAVDRGGRGVNGAAVATLRPSGRTGAPAPGKYARFDSPEANRHVG